MFRIFALPALVGALAMALLFRVARDRRGEVRPSPSDGIAGAAPQQ